MIPNESTRKWFKSIMGKTGNETYQPLVCDPTTHALTTITAATETDIVDGGKTIILTLTNDTWVADIGSDNAQTQALIDGLTNLGV